MGGGTGTGLPASQRRWRYLGCIIGVGLIVLLPAGVALTAVLAEAGVIHDTSYPPGVHTAVVAVVCLLICAALAMLAVHFEHRLRGIAPGRLETGLSKIASAGHRPGAQHAGARSHRRYGRYRRVSPGSSLVSGIGALAFGVLSLIGLAAINSDAGRSSDTQQHGIPATATVRSVSAYHGKVSTESTVAVALRPPVRGHRASSVKIPESVSYRRGQVIYVLVDPADLGYAELPGKPDTTVADVGAVGVLAAVGLVMGISFLISSVRMRARLRRSRKRRAEDLPSPAADQRGTDQPVISDHGAGPHWA